MTPRYALIRRVAELTGYSEKAINEKIDSGVWIEGVHWRKSPDGKRQINLEEYEKWVEGQPVAFSRARNQYASNSSGKAAA